MFCSLYYVHVTRDKLPKQRLYENFVRLTLMKLTPDDCGRNRDRYCNEQHFKEHGFILYFNSLYLNYFGNFSIFGKTCLRKVPKELICQFYFRLKPWFATYLAARKIFLTSKVVKSDSKKSTTFFNQGQVQIQ